MAINAELEQGLEVALQKSIEHPRINRLCVTSSLMIGMFGKRQEGKKMYGKKIGRRGSQM
jgi:hypothetical protein